MTYSISSDDSEAQREFDRLIAMPDPKMTGLLSAELESVYAATNAFTHRETGSLARSEKIEKPLAGPGQWEGRLEWGGPSAPKDVDYAIYERARGDDHDFVKPAIASEPEWIAAIKKGLGR